MSPVVSSSVTVTADFDTVTPAVSSSVIVTVTVHTDPQELPDASTSEMRVRKARFRSIARCRSFVVLVA